MKDCAEYECSFLRSRELTIHSKSLQQAIFIFSIYQISEKQFWRVLIGSCNSEYPWLCTVWRPGARLSKVPLDNFSGPKSFYVCCVCIQDQNFNKFENDTMKLSVSEQN